PSPSRPGPARAAGCTGWSGRGPGGRTAGRRAQGTGDGERGGASAAGEEGRERVAHLARRLPALRTRFGERAGDRRGERLGCVAPQAPQIGGRVMLLHVEHGGGAGRRERGTARE